MKKAFEPRAIPGQPAIYAATPRVAEWYAAFRGMRYEGVCFDLDAVRNLERIYGFDPLPLTRADHEANQAACRAAHDAAQAKQYPKTEFRPTPYEDALLFLSAGSSRNLMRHVVRDGLRVMSILAKHVDDGEDPVKVLIRLLDAAKYEVDGHDLMWALEEPLVDDDAEEENPG